MDAGVYNAVTISQQLLKFKVQNTNLIHGTDKCVCVCLNVSVYVEKLLHVFFSF